MERWIFEVSDGAYVKAWGASPDRASAAKEAASVFTNTPEARAIHIYRDDIPATSEDMGSQS